jgi:hypothetical protein
MRNPCVLPILALILLAVSPAAHAQREDFSFWTQIAASDAAAGARFGRQVILSSDGSTALVSSAMGDCSASPCAPATYVFVRDRGTWVQQAKLSSPGNPPGETGLSIAISGDGNTAFLGVPTASCGAGGRCGIAYVYSRRGTDWTLQQTLRALDARAQGYFGVTISLSRDGNTAIIGAIGASCGIVLHCGAAYVFTQSGGVWTERQRLVEPGPSTSPYFAGLVALSGDGNTALVVGGPDFGSYFSGRVYVFTRSGDVWSFQGLVAPPAGILDFAISAEISGDGNILLVRGDTDGFAGGGSVFVFIRTGSTWSQEAVLSGVSALDDFGASFDLTDDGQTAIVLSRPVGCAPGSSCGTADVFSRNGGAWDRVQRLKPPGAAQNYLLGPVSLSGDGTTALLSDPGQPCSAGINCGAAYLFTRAPLAVGIPTLGGAGLALLTLALAAGALILLQRRRSL